MTTRTLRGRPTNKKYIDISDYVSDQHYYHSVEQLNALRAAVAKRRAELPAHMFANTTPRSLYFWLVEQYLLGRVK